MGALMLVQQIVHGAPFSALAFGYPFCRGQFGDLVGDLEFHLRALDTATVLALFVEQLIGHVPGGRCPGEAPMLS